jgi:hypothetical protein
MRVGALALAVVSLCLTATAALAQATSPAAARTDVTGHLPAGTWLLVVVGIGLAAYISYRLGHKQAAARRRRGPISRALEEGDRE